MARDDGTIRLLQPISPSSQPPQQYKQTEVLRLSIDKSTRLPTVLLDTMDGGKVLPFLYHYSSKLSSSSFLEEEEKSLLEEDNIQYDNNATSSQKRVTTTTTILCSLQSLDPYQLTLSLFQKGDIQGALDVAMRATAISFLEEKKDEENTMENSKTKMAHIADQCRKQLWKIDGNSEAFLDIRDDEYVIGEVLLLCDITNKTTMEGMNSEQLINIVTNAWQRFQRIQATNTTATATTTTATTTTAATITESSISQKNKLRSILNRIGTIQILISFMNKQNSQSDLVKSISNLPAMHLLQSAMDPNVMMDLVQSLAVRGDICALTLLLLRHYPHENNNNEVH